MNNGRTHPVIRRFPEKRTPDRNVSVISLVKKKGPVFYHKVRTFLDEVTSASRSS